MEKLQLDESLLGLRLDDALAKAGCYLSRTKASEAIKQEKVLVNGKKGKASYRLEAGDEVQFEALDAPVSTLEKQDIPLEIVYEDDDILVINKPTGLVVHPGAGHHDQTLANALLYHFDDLPEGDSLRPGLVHRIDKDTSGLLAIAKTEAAYAGLQAQLKDHSMHREYRALVNGIILEDDGKIIAPIGRSRKEPLKNCVDIEKGKEAITYFHVLERFRASEVTYVDCRLLTGRTHQIRVHMEYIDHPVLGDPLYGRGNRKLYDKGQLLHAYRLTLVHPASGKEMTFEAPLPKHFVDMLDELKRKEALR